jgi:hypothetical protein
MQSIRDCRLGNIAYIVNPRALVYLLTRGNRHCFLCNIVYRSIDKGLIVSFMQLTL